MVRHEISLITTLLTRTQKIETLKEVVGYLLKKGHNVRQVQSLGDRCLPFVMRTPTDSRVNEGSYFVLDTDFRLKDTDEIKHKLKHMDNVMKATCIIHSTVYRENNSQECEGKLQVDYLTKLEELKKQPTPGKKVFNVEKVIQGVPFPIR